MMPAKWHLEADIHFEAEDFPAACRLIAAHWEHIAQVFESDEEIPDPGIWYHGRMALKPFEDKRWRILRDGSI